MKIFSNKKIRENEQMLIKSLLEKGLSERRREAGSATDCLDRA